MFGFVYEDSDIKKLMIEKFLMNKNGLIRVNYYLYIFIPSIFFRIISSKIIKTNLFVFSSKYFSILDLFIQTSSKRYFIHKIFLSTIIKRYYSFMVFQIPFGFYIVDNIKFK